jgi:hypothetical protein
MRISDIEILKFANSPFELLQVFNTSEIGYLFLCFFLGFFLIIIERDWSKAQEHFVRANIKQWVLDIDR